MPAKYLKSPISKTHSITTSSTQDAYDFLASLIRFHLSSVPFENLSLHYSSHRSIFLSPTTIFNKIVKNHRGGYCMEKTTLFSTVLRSLGYDVMTTGARVNVAIQPTSQNSLYTGPIYDAWNHMVLIVTLGTQKYLVDVGFGNNCATFPIPLDWDVGYSAINIQPEFQMLLRREHIPDATHRIADENRLWVYSVRHSMDATSSWIPSYCFNSDVEFLPTDYETMNFFVSKHPKSWFTYSLVCSKFLMDEETEEIVGDITLFGSDVKERRNGVSKSLARGGNVIVSEEERIGLLDELFGIKLAPEEQESITGMVTMI